MTSSAPDPGAEFESHRPHLLAIAYRFLGAVSEAEDIVQETYLRWAAADRSEIRDARAFLTRVAARLCLDQLKSARVRRERYVGPWLPEPVVEAAGFSTPAMENTADDISVALMLALERLSPLERAAFILHDVFGAAFEEVAEALDRSPATCRQLATRARSHLRTARPRFAVSRDEGERLAAAFLEANQTGDLEGLKRVLTADAVLHSDSGGNVKAARRHILGADRIARMYASIRRRNGPFRSAEPVQINGQPGLLTVDGHGITQTIAFEFRDGLISAIYLVRNPEKLRHLPGQY